MNHLTLSHMFVALVVSVPIFPVYMSPSMSNSITPNCQMWQRVQQNPRWSQRLTVRLHSSGFETSSSRSVFFKCSSSCFCSSCPCSSARMLREAGKSMWRKTFCKNKTVSIQAFVTTLQSHIPPVDLHKMKAIKGKLPCQAVAVITATHRIFCLGLLLWRSEPSKTKVHYEGLTGSGLPPPQKEHCQ